MQTYTRFLQTSITEALNPPKKKLDEMVFPSMI